jgi:hypothetical protein
MEVTATLYLLPVTSLFVFQGSTRVWNQCFLLARQVLYHLSHVPSSFWFRCFFNRVLCLCPSWPGLWSSYSVFLLSWDGRYMPLHLGFYWLGWGLVNLLFRLASNHNSSDLHFQVAGIMDVSHCAGLPKICLDHVFLKLYFHRSFSLDDILPLYFFNLKQDNYDFY